MSEGLHVMETVLNSDYEVDYLVRNGYLTQLFEAVRACAEVERSAGPETHEVTLRASVAILRPDTYRRLLAAARELGDLKRATL